MFRVHYRDNAGIDHYSVEIPSIRQVEELAKELRNTTNYLVCIEENNKRILRWDKEANNRWRKAKRLGIQHVLLD